MPTEPLVRDSTAHRRADLVSIVTQQADSALDVELAAVHNVSSPSPPRTTFFFLPPLQLSHAQPGAPHMQTRTAPTAEALVRVHSEAPDLRGPAGCKEPDARSASSSSGSHSALEVYRAAPRESRCPPVTAR